MIPKTREYSVGYIIEFKSISTDANLEKTILLAKSQVQNKSYDAALLSAGVQPERIRQLAVVLQGKRVIVRE